MKITLYTVNNCQFSNAEKEYLKAHNLSYEEKNLEQNREWLSEMLAVSNNFAGTPVTKIEKDDGQIVVVKGYNKEELDEILGFNKKEEAVVNATIDIPNQTQPAQTGVNDNPQQPTQSQGDQPNTQAPMPPPIPPSNEPSPVSQPSQQPIPTPPSPPPSVNQPNENPEPPVVNQPPQPTTNDLKLESLLSDLQQKANPNPTPDLPNLPDFSDNQPNQ